MIAMVEPGMTNTSAPATVSKKLLDLKVGDTIVDIQGSQFRVVSPVVREDDQLAWNGRDFVPMKGWAFDVEYDVPGGVADRHEGIVPSGGVIKGADKILYRVIAE